MNSITWLRLGCIAVWLVGACSSSHLEETTLANDAHDETSALPDGGQEDRLSPDAALPDSADAQPDAPTDTFPDAAEDGAPPDSSLDAVDDDAADAPDGDGTEDPLLCIFESQNLVTGVTEYYSENIWSSDGRVPVRYEAGGHVLFTAEYELGLTDELLSASYDRDDDGLVDQIVRWTLRTDEETRLDYDDDADGTVDWTLRILRDSLGRPVEHLVESGGLSDSVAQWTYDDLGRLVSSRYPGSIVYSPPPPYDSNPVGDPEHTCEYTYMDDGQRVTVCDGVPWSTRSITTHPSPDVTRIEHRALDDDHLIWALEYSLVDGVRLDRWDTNGDGSFDRTVRYEYDDRGRLILVETDDGIDGTIDRRATHTWDCMP